MANSSENRKPFPKPEEKKEFMYGDPGIDDSFAFFVRGAMKGNVALIATYGNAETKVTSSNLVGISDFMQKHLKPQHRKTFEVFTGADKPFGSKLPYTTDLVFIHGQKAVEGQFQGFPPSKDSATVLYDKTTHEDGKISVISMAAVTEVAKRLQKKDLKGRIGSIAIMGGTLFRQGNVDTHVEANFAHDPVALDIVLDTAAKERIPLTLVPLDVTENRALEFTADRAKDVTKKLRANGSDNMANMILNLAGPGTTYPKFYQAKESVLETDSPDGYRHFKGPMLHDVTLVLAEKHPEIFTIVKTPVIQRYPRVIGAPTAWEQFDYSDASGKIRHWPPPSKQKPEVNLVLGVKNPEAYWDKVVTYLSRYD